MPPTLKRSVKPAGEGRPQRDDRDGERRPYNREGGDREGGYRRREPQEGGRPEGRSFGGGFGRGKPPVAAVE